VPPNVVEFSRRATDRDQMAGSVTVAIVVAAAVAGMAVGSFLGVVVDRVPEGRSIVHPPSHCGACGTALPWYDNIPVVSFLALRGRCRRCRAPIGVEALGVELAGGAAAALAAAAMGHRWAVVGGCLWALTAVGVVAVAVGGHRPLLGLPVAGAAAGWLACAGAAALTGHGWPAVGRATLGLAAVATAGVGVQVVARWRSAGAAGQPSSADPPGRRLATRWATVGALAPTAALLGWLGPAAALAGTVVGPLWVAGAAARSRVARGRRQSPRVPQAPAGSRWLAGAAAVALVAGTVTSLVAGGR